MTRKEIIEKLEKLNIKFSKKSNTKVLYKKLENNTITKGVKAFMLLENNILQTGNIGGSQLTTFEENKTYEVSSDREIQLCNYGFHFYKENNSCFGTAMFGDRTVFHEIIAYGNIISDTEKCVARKIKIGKRIYPILDKYYNTGNYNTGSRNSGDWNTTNRETGFFNNKDINTIRVFNKPCDIKVWRNAKKPSFLYFKIRENESYKDAFIRSWNEATDADKKLIELLPNFDWEVFTDISGIKKP